MRDPQSLKLSSLAGPIFVEQGLRILVGTVDMLMVSHLGDGAVAALGVAFQVVGMSIIVFNFIGVGSSVVITHHLGAHDRPGADRISRAAIGFNTWVGLGVSALVALFARPLLGWMQLPETLLPHAVPFLTLMGGTLFLEAQNIAMSATLRAHAYTRPVMAVTAFQNVANLAGNALLLFGLFGLPKLGVPAVALSGVVSRIISFVILRSMVQRKTGVQLSLRDYFALSREQLRRILTIGLPAAGENLSYWLALVVVTSFASRMGEASIAAFSYSRQMTMWVILFSMSIGLATEILVGYRVGAGDFDRAHRELIENLRKGVACVLGVSGLVAIFTPWLLRGFTRDPAIIDAVAQLAWLGVLLETGRVLNVVVVNSLRATGDARFPLFMGFWSMWGMWVPLAWVLSLKLGLGLNGIVVAMICDEWLRGLLNYARWKRRGWVKHAERSRAHVTAMEPSSDPAS